MVAALVRHPGVGFVVARTVDGGTVVISKTGIRHLDKDRVEGVDPLAAFGPDAVADVRRHDTLPHVGDLVINSPLDQSTGEVAAYEELVGCHGGLGGWQTDAVLVHPSEWPVDEQPLVGADAVHRQLVRWLERLGQRRSLTLPEPAPSRPGAAAAAAPHAGGGTSRGTAR